MPLTIDNGLPHVPPFPKRPSIRLTSKPPPESSTAKLTTYDDLPAALGLPLLRLKTLENALTSSIPNIDLKANLKSLVNRTIFCRQVEPIFCSMLTTNGITTMFNGNADKEAWMAYALYRAAIKFRNEEVRADAGGTEGLAEKMKRLERIFGRACDVANEKMKRIEEYDEAIRGWQKRVEERQEVTDKRVKDLMEMVRAAEEKFGARFEDELAALSLESNTQPDLAE